MGALGAAAMIGATIGLDTLLGYLKKKKTVRHEADDDDDHYKGRQGGTTAIALLLNGVTRQVS